MDPLTCSRRDFMKLAGLGGVVLVSGCATTMRSPTATADDDFYFVQLSDCHWGFEGPAINPDAKGTLQEGGRRGQRPVAPAGLRRVHRRPDAHDRRPEGAAPADDRVPRDRRRAQGQGRAVHARRARRVARQRQGVQGVLRRDALHVRPQGRALHRRSTTSPTRWPRSGRSSCNGSRADLAAQPRDARIVVFTHRPLFDLYPQWDWATRDGAQAIALLQTRDNVTVFYGHIHQENHFMTGNVAHHSAKGLMFALPVAGVAAEAPADPVGCRARPTRASATAKSRPSSAPGEIRDHRIAGRLGGAMRPASTIAAARSGRGRTARGWPGRSRVRAQGKPRVIPISARKFTYEPDGAHAQAERAGHLPADDAGRRDGLQRAGLRGSRDDHSGPDDRRRDDADQDRRVHVPVRRVLRIGHENMDGTLRVVA